MVGKINLYLVVQTRNGYGLGGRQRRHKLHQGTLVEQLGGVGRGAGSVFRRGGCIRNGRQSGGLVNKRPEQPRESGQDKVKEKH